MKGLNTMPITNDNKGIIKITSKMDGELRKNIKKWGGMKVFEKLLIDIIDDNFELYKDEILYLDKIDTSIDGKLSFNFGYEDENRENFLINFYYTAPYNRFYNDPTYKILVKWIDSDGFSYRVSYHCYSLKNRLNVIERFDPFEEKMVVTKEINGIKYERNIDDGDLVIYVHKDNYCIRINGYVGDGYNIFNDNVVFEYLFKLMNLGSDIENINLFDVYNKICSMAFENEPTLYVNLYKDDKKINGFNVERTAVSGHTNCIKRVFYINAMVNDIKYHYYIPKDKKNLENGILQITVMYSYYKLVIEVRAKDTNEINLDNELELKEYLMKLSGKLKIEDIYKDICLISLGDISQYNEINIKILDRLRAGIVLEEISLKDGKLELFQINRDGRVIKIDNNGNFSYQREDSDTKIFVNLNNNIITKCEYSTSKEIDTLIDGRIENPIENVIKEIKSEKVRVRKIIDDISNK